MSNPYLSLAILTRDPEGAATLERALRSALERPDGPMCDEIVILFGGDPHAKCAEIVARLSLEFPSVAWQTFDLPADMPRTDDGGLADFAAARNFLYSKCKGVWLGFLDADDLIPSAYVASAKTAAPSEAPSFTMKAFLQQLPKVFNSLTFSYHYAHDVEGNVIVESSREWVRWRDGFTWVNRSHGHHEAIFPVYPNKRNLAELKGFYLEHRPPDDAAARRVRRNDALLDAAKYMQESVHGMTDRWGVQYYLARQAERRNLYELAAQHGEQCCALARNDEEKYTSLHALSRVLRCMRSTTMKQIEAMSAALLAYNVAPLRGEAIGDMIQLNLDVGDPIRAAEWYGRLLALPKSDGLGIEYNAYEVELWPHVCASRAFLTMERFDEAVAAAERAVRFAPYDVGAAMAKKDAIAARDLRRSRDAARYLLEFAARRDDTRRVRGLFESLPYVLENDPELSTTLAQAESAWTIPDAPSSTAARLRAEATADDRGLEVVVVPYGTAPDGQVGKRQVYTPQRLLDEISYPIKPQIERLERVAPDDADSHREGAIVMSYIPGTVAPDGPTVSIFCPECLEPWGPFSAERSGTGGSEEMVIQVSRYLGTFARVTVYAPVDDVTVDRNVVWRPIQTFDPDATCDVLISHRSAHLARREKIGAKIHYAWLHDAVMTHLTEDYEESRQSRIKAYLTLSEWQENEYHTRYGIPRAQMIRVPNAPDPEDSCPEPPVCDNCSGDGCDNCSGDGRIARRAVWASAPYRGLNILLALWPLVREQVPDAEMHICTDWQIHDALAKIYPELARLKDIILANKEAPGLVWRGRLTAPALRKEFQISNVLAYPTTFAETSCRAAIRAMACGCMPVYRPYAALSDTIGTLGLAVPGNPGDIAYLKQFADALVEAMLNPPTTDERRAMSEESIARHSPWDTWLGLVRDEAKVKRGLVAA